MNNLTLAGGPYEWAEMYTSGCTIAEVAKAVGRSVSTVRRGIMKVRPMRSAREAANLAASKGRMGSGFRGKTRVLSEAHIAAVRAGRKRWGEENGKGWRITRTGYREFTRGEHAGRLEHVVVMEGRIGRRILRDECVHHIDGDSLNNHEDNLALMTRAAHSRLHRREDALSGKAIVRSDAGRWTAGDEAKA